MYHLTNPDTGTHVYFLRNDGACRSTPTLPVPGAELPVRRPGAGRTAAGRRDQAGAADSCGTPPPSPCWPSAAGRQDIAVLTGRAGESTVTALECASRPTVTVLDGGAERRTRRRAAADQGPTRRPDPGVGVRRRQRHTPPAAPRRRRDLPAAVPARHPVRPGAGVRARPVAGDVQHFKDLLSHFRVASNGPCAS